MISRQQRIMSFADGGFEIHVAIAVQTSEFPAAPADQDRVSVLMKGIVDDIARPAFIYATATTPNVLNVSHGGLAILMPSPGCQRSGAETAASFVSVAMVAERFRFLVVGFHTCQGLYGTLAACTATDAEAFTRTASNFIAARRGTFDTQDVVGTDPNQPPEETPRG